MIIYRLAIIALFMVTPLMVPGILIAKPQTMHQSSLSIDQKDKQDDAAAHPAPKKHSLNKHRTKHVAKHNTKRIANHSLESLKGKDTAKKTTSDKETQS